MKPRRIKLRQIVLMMILLLLWAPGFGMDWPSQDAVILNNFGWINGKQPVMGVSFASRGPIHAAAAGELLFVHSQTNTASRMPSPLGSWAALDHGDWLIGIYSRFEDKAETGYPTIVEKDGIIASSGRSGWTKEDGFYFSFFDRKERRWVNPSMFITPMPDTRAPVIQGVQLKNGDDRIINPASTRSLSQGRYVVSVQVNDTRLSPGENPLAPHRIACSVNGIEIGGLSFETFTARDGFLMINRNGLVTVEQIYAPAPFFEIGEIWFNRGQANLEIIAYDIGGNVRNVAYRLQIE
ncbi:MAG: hypothetical protein LBJ24_01550 [Treponema sp.]|jgi:hypothetical protein|nr:hypothetical protein [Treponema sp.]